MTRYKTDLRCGACVAKITPLLDADALVGSWSADVASADKVLAVGGPATPAHVAAVLGRAGYRVLGELPADRPVPPPAADPPPTYFPLALVVGYLVGVVGLVEWTHGQFNWPRAMGNFMGGFFLAFSFFKMLDLRAFADAFATYDLVAARSRTYALAYPFVELGLGVAYVVGFAPAATNAVTLAVMLVGAAGVFRTLVARRKARCACLGGVFNLPMSTVTLVEDLLMAGMAAAMLGLLVAS